MAFKRVGELVLSGFCCRCSFLSVIFKIALKNQKIQL